MKAFRFATESDRSIGLPLAAHIAALGFAVALPLLVLAGYLLYWNGKAERTRLEAQAGAEARDLALLIDRELAGLTAMLQALAISPPLRAGDLEQFDRRAREMLGLQGTNIVLRDLTGQQLVNTRAPWGTPLPRGADISDTDRMAQATRRPQVTDLFTGALVGRPLFMVEVPVTRDDEVAYLLGVSMPVEYLGELIRGSSLAPGWWATLVDRNGIILARTLSPESTVGSKVTPEAREALAEAEPSYGLYLVSPEGIRNFAAFHRVGSTGWTVGVAVPESVLMAPLHASMRWIAALVAVAVAVSGVLAFLHGRRIAGEATALRAAAVALGRGETMTLPPLWVRELNTVGEGIAAAGRELVARAAEREDLLQTLGRSPVIVRSFDGRISFWGAGAEKLYGYTAQEAQGRLSHELLSTQFPKPLEALQAALLARGEWEGELRHRSKDGTELVVASHWALWCSPLGREAMTVVETNTDLSAKLAQTVAEEASRAKTSFLAAISHDLRQPFQAMRLFLQILEAQAPTSLGRVVDNMGRALSSGEEMLSAIIDLSVMDAGKLEAKPTYFSLDQLLAEVADDCGPMARSANLSLRRVGSSAVVFTDRGLLKRIVRNLVVNAIRYTKEGGVVIGCRRRGEGVVVQVVDSGIGIPQDKLARIFEEFYQVGNRSGDSRRGLGLGLAIVSRLSHLLGLPVHVASTYGRGSVFGIGLAIADAPFPLASPTPSSASATAEADPAGGR